MNYALPLGQLNLKHVKDKPQHVVVWRTQRLADLEHLLAFPAHGGVALREVLATQTASAPAKHMRPFGWERTGPGPCMLILQLDSQAGPCRRARWDPKGSRHPSQDRAQAASASLESRLPDQK